MNEALIVVTLAGAASFLFGSSQVVSKSGLAHVDAQTGALITIGTALLAYTVTMPWWAVADEWLTPGFWVFVVNGLFHPMLSMYLALEATARTGPTVAGTFAATTPIFAAVIAVAFLGETVGPGVVAGTLVTVLGVATLSWEPGSATRVVRAALLFATGAALIRGLNHPVGKFGLSLTPNVYLASFVSFAVSFAGTLVIYRLRRGSFPRRVPAAGLRWFGLNGLMIAGAIGMMYGALARGEVVVVAPIIASYPLFALLMSVAGGHERLTRRLLGGVVLVVAGVVAVSVAKA